MRLIEKIIENKAIQKEKKKEKLDIKKFLNTKLPCNHIVKLSNGVMYMYALTEYTPSALSMLLNTGVDFDCKFKILTGAVDVGKIYNVNRYNDDNSICKYELTDNGLLNIHISRYKAENIDTSSKALTFLQCVYGDEITVRELIKRHKINNKQRPKIHMTSPRDYNMIRTLYYSDDIFIKERDFNYISLKGDK
jgi:hypothetical protein